MTGFAIPEVLVEIVASFVAGDKHRAHSVHERALPLLLFAAQASFGAAIRKAVLHRRGISGPVEPSYNAAHCARNSTRCPGRTTSFLFRRPLVRVRAASADAADDPGRSFSH